MKRLAPFAAAALLAACAQPGGPDAQASAGPPGSAKAATVCKVVGFRWERYGDRINPTMTVSNDGFCQWQTALYNSTIIGATVAVQPQHGCQVLVLPRSWLRGT